MARKMIQGSRKEDVVWIHLAQGRDMWKVLVNTVKTFGLHKREGISWLAE
jgi:hypothetical protein